MDSEPARRRSGQLRRLLVPALAFVAVTAVTGCGGNSPGGGTSQSVFRVKAGQCFLPPTKVKAELTSVDRVSCDRPHTQEAYAVVAFAKADTTDYPGDTALKQFADGTCAAKFAKYVGVDYQDSSLFFTYLLPSARGWQQAHDREVVCFVTTTGSLLHKSVKGTKV